MIHDGVNLEVNHVEFSLTSEGENASCEQVYIDFALDELGIAATRTEMDDRIAANP